MKDDDDRQEVLGPDDDDYVGDRHPPKHSRWKPGQSGNPAGKLPTRRTSIIKSLIRNLEKAATDGMAEPDDTWADRVAQALIQLGATPNSYASKAIGMILDRVDGPVRTELSGPDGTPLFLPKVYIGIDPQLAATGTLALGSIGSMGSVVSAGAA